jgi:hypothetical protein
MLHRALQDRMWRRVRANDGTWSAARTLELKN